MNEAWAAVIIGEGGDQCQVIRAKNSTSFALLRMTKVCELTDD